MLSEKKLDFVCVGAQKAGTTSLDRILRFCSVVALPVVKETKFFRDETSIDETALDRYWRLFEEARVKDGCGGSVAGEIDPDYLYFDDVARRLFSHNPRMRIVVLLRDPVERAYSHYLMSALRGYDNREFLEAVMGEAETLATGGEFSKRHHSYVARGKYAEQVERYLKVFPREQIGVWAFEDFVDRQDSVVAEILDFIGVDSTDIPRISGVNENRRGVARSRWVQKILYSDNAIRRGARLLFNGNPRLRRNIRAWLQAANKRVGERKEMGGEARTYLRQEFVNDARRLDGILGTGFLRRWGLPQDE